MKQKKKKQEESGRDRDVLASARSLVNGGRGQDGEEASQSSPGAGKEIHSLHASELYSTSSLNGYCSRGSTGLD
jgi:hypothetical protein